MEVKEIRYMRFVPHVFLTPNLVKFSLTDLYINCTRYSSRSGATQNGCIHITLPNFQDYKTVRGIYYTSVSPIVDISFRRKYNRDESDVIALLKNMNIDGVLKDVGVDASEILVVWDNYYVIVYDRFNKGKIYEFPLLNIQGNLTIYEIPPFKGAYRVNEEKVEIVKDSFDEINEFHIYNHRIITDTPVWRLKNVHVFGGNGVVIYVPQGIHIKVESPDHQGVDFSVNGEKWVLFSHPRPKTMRD